MKLCTIPPPLPPPPPPMPFAFFPHAEIIRHLGHMPHSHHPFRVTFGAEERDRFPVELFALMARGMNALMSDDDSHLDRTGAF